MLRDLWRKYRVDGLLLLLLGVLAIAVSVLAHADAKPASRVLAFAGPVVFATSLMALIAVMSLSKRYPALARSRRVLIDVAIASVLLAITLARAEMFYAPVELVRGTTPATVVEEIATNDNVLRYRAWARIATFSVEEKEQVARALADIILGEDGPARRSALLTLDYPLRRHTITALIAMAPELRSYLEAKTMAIPPPPKAGRAGAFTSAFVATDYKSILKALTPKHRGKLPAGGVDALFLALATNEPIGQLFLKGFAEQGDDLLKTKALEMLELIQARPTT